MQMECVRRFSKFPDLCNMNTDRAVSVPDFNGPGFGPNLLVLRYYDALGNVFMCIPPTQVHAVAARSTVVASNVDFSISEKTVAHARGQLGTARKTKGNPTKFHITSGE
jgi:hypothetical protein